MNDEELRLEIHAQVNSAAQKQVNAAYTGQTSPIDTAVNVDAIMQLIKPRDQQIALAARIDEVQLMPTMLAPYRSERLAAIKLEQEKAS